MNSSYPLLIIVLITLIAIVVSKLFVQWEIVPENKNRKFWNYLLLFSFLASGLLGLVSVIKINYKLSLQYYDSVLKWHVSLGILMVMVSIYHIFKHLNYFFPFVRRYSGKKRKRATVLDEPKNRFSAGKTRHSGYRTLLFLLGFGSVVCQVTLLRVFINVLSGNELVIGVMISAWMLLTALGAYFARNSKPEPINYLQGIRMLVSIFMLTMLSMALIYILKSILFPPGTIVGLGISAIASLILLFPVCVLSGYLFTRFSVSISLAENQNLIGKAYGIESLGSLAGGLIFSLFFSRLFDGFFLLSALTGIYLGIFLIEHRFLPQYQKYTFIGFGILFPITILLLNPDDFFHRLLYPNQKMVLNHSTNYGNLVITQQSGQMNVYENNELQFYTDNSLLNEESVHYALSQLPKCENVLLISGGISGMIPEINKYNVQKITYLETNPDIFRYLSEFKTTEYQNNNVEIVQNDIRLFLKNTKDSYDAILINLPPPGALSGNRFYTNDFFKIVKLHLNPGGIICTGLPSTANYAGENSVNLNESLWNTLRISFKEVKILMGERNHFIASDSTLTDKITELIEKKQIKTNYVNKYYVNDTLLVQRSNSLIARFTGNAPVNRDFFPYMFMQQNNHWLSHFGINYNLLVIIPLILFAVLIFKTDRITIGLYTGGFSAASLEIALMLAYQIYFGNLYVNSALFFALFMGGLALGSIIKVNPSFLSVKQYINIQFILSAFAFVLPLLIAGLGRISEIGFLSRVIIFAVVVLFSFGIGLQFRLAASITTINYSKMTGVNYATDLAGSAFGAYLTSIFLLPRFGLTVTCIICGALTLISGFFALPLKKIH